MRRMIIAGICGFMGGVCSHWFAPTPVAAQATKTIRTERLEIVNNAGTPVIILETLYSKANPKGAGHLSMTDPSSKNQVSITTARLLMQHEPDEAEREILRKAAELLGKQVGPLGREGAILAPGNLNLLRPNGYVNIGPDVADDWGFKIRLGSKPEGMMSLNGERLVFYNPDGSPRNVLPR